MSVGHAASESLHKSRARLLVSTANEVKAPPLYRPLRAVTGHCSWPLSKNSPALPSAPPLHYDPSHNLLRGWVTLSGTSITATLISPLVGRAKGLVLTWYIFFFIYIFFFFFCLSAALGAFRVWIPLLTNKFVWSQLSSSPRGASPPLCLTFSPSFLLTAFIPCLHMHSPNPPKDFHPGWNLQLQKQEPPLLSEPSLSDCLQFVFHNWLPPCLYSFCI